MMISHASVHELPAAKQIVDSAHPFLGGVLYEDKAYIDEEWEIIVNVIDFRPISSCKLPDERHSERVQAYKVVYYTQQRVRQKF